MFYHISRILFIITAKYLSWFFRSRCHFLGGRILRRKAKSVDKHLIKLKVSLRTAVEIPDKRVLDRDINKTFVSRLPKHIVYRAEQLRLYSEKEGFDAPAKGDVLLFFDTDYDDSCVSSASLQDAINKLDQNYEGTKSL